MSPTPLEYETSWGSRSSAAGWIAPLRRAVPILVFGAVISIALIAYWPRPRTPALQTLAASGAQQVWAALLAFNSEHGRLPTQEEGLSALLKPPALAGKTPGPYLPRLLTDPWGRPYVWRGIPNAGPRLSRSFVVSLGPDGKEFTDDDLLFAH